MNFDDDLLTLAAKQAGEHLSNEIQEQEATEHIFSERFDAGMQKLLARARRPLWQRQLVKCTRCAAVIMVAGFVGLSVCLMGVEAWRTRFFSMVEEKFPDHSRITFENTTGEEFEQGAFVSFALHGVPEGFTCVEYGVSDFFNHAYYENEAGSRIFFDQSRVDSITIALNTEGAALEPITLNGEPAQFLTNMGMQTVLWNDDAYCFTVLTDLPRETAIALAQGVRAKTPAPPLPRGYDEQDAARKGDVVLSNAGNQNLERLDAFLANCATQKTDEISLSVFTKTGVQLKRLRCDGDQVTYYHDGFADPTSEDPWVTFETFDRLEREEDGDFMRLLLYTSHYAEPVEAARYQ